MHFFLVLISFDETEEASIIARLTKLHIHGKVWNRKEERVSAETMGADGAAAVPDEIGSAREGGSWMDCSFRSAPEKNRLLAYDWNGSYDWNATWPRMSGWTSITESCPGTAQGQERNLNKRTRPKTDRPLPGGLAMGRASLGHG